MFYIFGQSDVDVWVWARQGLGEGSSGFAFQKGAADGSARDSSTDLELERTLNGP